MKDRSTEYPNRYRMTLVPGTTDIYEITPAPGEVYEDGTLMSKANILDDNSELDIWGTIGDRTPNDAFSFIGKSLTAHDEDIAKLAATVEGKIVTGTYTGNGTASRTISLGFTPKAVLIVPRNAVQVTCSVGTSAKAYGTPFLATPDNPSYGYETQHIALSIVEGGFNVWHYDGTPSGTSTARMVSANTNSAPYNYIAIV